MKVYKQNELTERQALINRLTFSIGEYSEEDDSDYNSDVLCIEFFDTDGCLYDNDDLTYYLQNDIPDEMYEESEGLFTYNTEMNDGKFSKADIENILLKIGFKKE